MLRVRVVRPGGGVEAIVMDRRPRKIYGRQFRKVQKHPGLSAWGSRAQ